MTTRDHRDYPDVLYRQLLVAEQVSRMGSFAWSSEDGSWSWTPGLYRVLGLDTDLPPGLATYALSIPEPERATWLSRAAHRLEVGIDYEREYQMARPENGDTIWVRVRGQNVTIGDIRYVIGTVQDVTEKVLARRALEDLNTQLMSTVQRQQETIQLLDAARTFVAPSRT